MKHTYIYRNLLSKAARLQPPAAFGDSPEPPFGHGVDAVAAVQDATPFAPGGAVVLELAAKLDGGAAAGAKAREDATAAVGHIDRKAAEFAAGTPEAAAATKTRAALAKVTAELATARTDLTTAQAAFKAGIRVSPDPQLRANVEFHTARVEDLTAAQLAASTAHREAESRVNDVRAKHRSRLLAEARQFAAERRAELVEFAERQARQLADGLLTLAALDAALDAAGR